MPNTPAKNPASAPTKTSRPASSSSSDKFNPAICTPPAFFQLLDDALSYSYVCRQHRRHPLMSHVKIRSMRKGFPQALRKVWVGMIVQGWKQNPETSVNKLLFAGSRMSVGSSGAVPV